MYAGSTAGESFVASKAKKLVSNTAAVRTENTTYNKLKIWIFT